VCVCVCVLDWAEGKERLGKAKERRAYIVGVCAGVGLLVDVDLDDHGPEHGGGAEEETEGNAFDGREAVASASEPLGLVDMSVGQFVSGR